MLATHSTPQLWATTVPSSFPVKMDEEQNDSKGRHRAVDGASLIRSKKNWTGTSHFWECPGPVLFHLMCSPQALCSPEAGGAQGWEVRWSPA